MLNATKIRIYPNKVQSEKLAKAFGCSRWLWNNSLAEMQKVYAITGKGIGQFDLTARLPTLKNEVEWLADPHSQVLQAVCLNLSKAFINFFERRSGYPRFKSKNGKQTIQYPQHVKLVERAGNKMKTLIEALEELPRYRKSDQTLYVRADDLRAIIEQYKTEGAEPVDVKKCDACRISWDEGGECPNPECKRKGKMIWKFVSPRGWNTSIYKCDICGTAVFKDEEKDLPFYCHGCKLYAYSDKLTAYMMPVSNTSTPSPAIVGELVKALEEAKPAIINFSDYWHDLNERDKADKYNTMLSDIAALIARAKDMTE